METQSRTKSWIWWLGMLSAAYEAFLAYAVGAGAELNWVFGGVGAVLAVVAVYANGNNPSIADKY